MLMPDEIEREFKQEALDAAIRIAKRDAKDIQKEPKIFDGFLGLGKGKNTFFDINKLSNDRGLNLSTQEIAKIINDSYQELELPNKFDISILPKKYRKQMQDGGELQNPEKADLDKDGKLSSYEQARGEAIEESMREQKQEGGLLNTDSSRIRYSDGELAGDKVEFYDRFKDIDDYSREKDKYLELRFLSDTLSEKELDTVYQNVMKGRTKNTQKILGPIVGKILGGGMNLSEQGLSFLSGFGADRIPIIPNGLITAFNKEADKIINKRKGKQEGGLLSDDREKYVLGSIASKLGSKASKLLKTDKETKGLENILLDNKYSGLTATFTKKELNKIKKDMGPDGLPEYKDFLTEFVSVKLNDYDYIKIAKSYGMSNKEISELLKKNDKEIRATLERIGMRNKKQEGGTAIENQMADMMPEEKTEEQKAIEKAQAPDEQMEENYVDFLIDEALSDDEEAMLMQELQANPQLSMLFDKVMEVAMEFSGSGPVEGPGTEVSDSIPARLSDGEFVFTAKSVDVLGADNLMSLMKQAEAQADQRQMAQEGGLMEEEETAMPVQQEPVRQDIRVTKETVGSQASVQEEDDLVGDELKKQMLSGRPHVRS